MKIHHVGYVVSSIDEFLKGFPSCTLERKIYDPIQQADLSLFAFENIYIELIEPKNETAFTFSFLRDQGSGYHHLCYEVGSLEEALTVIKQQKMIKVLGPVDALLFDNKKVVFAFTKNKNIAEFLIINE